MTDKAKASVDEMLGKINMDPLKGSLLKGDKDPASQLVSMLIQKAGRAAFDTTASSVGKLCELIPVNAGRQIIALNAAEAALSFVAALSSDKLQKAIVDAREGDRYIPRDAFLFAALLCVYSETSSTDHGEEHDDIEFHQKVESGEYNPIERAKKDFFALRGFQFEEKYGYICECKTCQQKRASKA